MAIDPANRAVFEKLGLELVIIDMPIGSLIQDGAMRGQALEWIGEQRAIKQRQDDRRFWAMVILTAIAAIAACIAAWPILHGA